MFIIYENLVSCGILSFVTLNQLIKFHGFFTIAAHCNKYNVECIVSVIFVFMQAHNLNLKNPYDLIAKEIATKRRRKREIQNDFCPNT